MSEGMDLVEGVFREARRDDVLAGPPNPLARLRSDAEVFWAAAGEPFRHANLVLGGAFADPREGVRQALQAMDGLPFAWFVRAEPRFAALRAALADAGFRRGEDEACMTLEPADARPPPSVPGLEIRRVADPAGVAAYLDVWEAAFDAGPEGRASWLRRHAPRLASDARRRHLLGLLDGRPVACGTAFLGREAVGVYSIGVLPEARGRGVGSAMAWRVVEEGRAEGLERAILGATPSGAGVYRRLGFRDAGRLEQWLPEGA